VAHGFAGCGRYPHGSARDVRGGLDIGEVLLDQVDGNIGAKRPASIDADERCRTTGTRPTMRVAESGPASRWSYDPSPLRAPRATRLKTRESSSTA
jgi:hypothetical protein